MDLFIRLIEILAWPFTLLLIIFGFRKYVANVISRLTQVNAAGISLSFSDKIEEAKERINNLTYGATAKSANGIGNPYQQLLQSQSQLESQLRSLARSNGIIVDGESFNQILDTLQQKNILSVEKAKRVQVITDLVNEANSSITAQQAKEVKTLIEQTNL